MTWEMLPKSPGGLSPAGLPRTSPMLTDFPMQNARRMGLLFPCPQGKGSFYPEWDRPKMVAQGLGGCYNGKNGTERYDL